MAGMTIQKATLDHLTPEAMRDIEGILTDGFTKELPKRVYSWKHFAQYWELSLNFPWNALWLLYDNEEEHVVGFIGGTIYPDIVSDAIIAAETCWRTAPSVKGKGAGWDLLATFMEWAGACGATRIGIHRMLSKDMLSDERFDTKVRQLGFYPSGCEYYLDLK